MNTRDILLLDAGYFTCAKVGFHLRNADSKLRRAQSVWSVMDCLLIRSWSMRVEVKAPSSLVVGISLKKVDVVV